MFSNEVARTEGEPGPGDIVQVLRYDGRFLGIGLYNPHSLIAVRMLSRTDIEIDTDFFRARLAKALAHRRALYPDDEAFRLVHGESDGLPGLIIDVYGNTAVLQVLSAGMDKRTGMVVEALQDVLAPEVVVARNDSPVRTLEGLDLVSTVLRGEPAPVVVHEHGIEYEVDVISGQKTGMFLDQKDNRFAVRRFLRSRRVLDCFSNVGGFALNAAAAGATEVTAVDDSGVSIEAARRHFAKNGLPAGDLVTADAFDHLAALQQRGERFGGIILDPPAFTRNRKTVATALKAYKKLNMLALSLLETDGILVTASCSHHISRDEFLNMVSESAIKTGKELRVLETRGAAADHPVLPAMPETEYLKLLVCAAA